MKAKDWLAFLLLGTIWGSSFVWIKLAIVEVGPFLLVAFRLLFGMIGLLVVVSLTHPAWPRDRRAWVMLTIFGFINSAIPYTLITWGERYIDSSVASILNSATPLFTMILAHLFLHDDKLSWQRLGGLLIGFIGVLVLFSRDLASGVHGALIGQLAVLLAAFCYALSAVFARRTTQGLSPIVQALIPLFGGDALVWLIASTVEKPIQVPHHLVTWIALAWLGFLGTCVAYLLYFYLLHSVGPTRTTLTNFFFPVAGVILGVVFLHERLDWHLLVGGGLIVGSIIVVNSRFQPAERLAEQSTLNP